MLHLCVINDDDVDKPERFRQKDGRTDEGIDQCLALAVCVAIHCTKQHRRPIATRLLIIFLRSTLRVKLIR